MKRRILYTIFCIMVGMTTFLIGNNTVLSESKADINNEIKSLCNTENGIELILSNGTAVHVDNIDLEENNYIDTKNIIDWNTDEKELSVLTENDYEFYAYKD